MVNITAIARMTAMARMTVIVRLGPRGGGGGGGGGGSDAVGPLFRPPKPSGFQKLNRELACMSLPGPTRSNLPVFLFEV
jgi:hypothetical protein